jgi:hypothetical protein
MQSPISRLGDACQRQFCRLSALTINPKKVAVMKRSIDYNIVWNDAMAMLRAHQEALLALSGVLLFLPRWILQFFAGAPDMSKVKDFNDIAQKYQEYITENWALILVTDLISLFGMVVLYVLLTRRDLVKVADALPVAFRLLPIYFVLQILVGMLGLASVYVFVVPGLYLLARFWLVQAALPGGANYGVLESLKRSWEITHGAGWKLVGLAAIITIVGFACYIVVLITIGSLMKLASGGVGVPFVETAFSAALATILNIVTVTVTVSVYNHLSAQDT